MEGDRVNQQAGNEATQIGKVRGNVNLVQKVTNFVLGDDTEKRNLRDRQDMLKLVKSFWVKGVLEQSLRGESLIKLSFKKLEDEVENPWNKVLQLSNRDDHPVPSKSEKIIDVFDGLERQCLLILGEPGSGKTTTLLELARDTINRAENDLVSPIPVVFNLSSWVNRKTNFADWLVNELNTKYNVPQKIGLRWIENDDLLLRSKE